jgi:hypothetical protein
MHTRIFACTQEHAFNHTRTHTQTYIQAAIPLGLLPPQLLLNLRDRVTAALARYPHVGVGYEGNSEVNRVTLESEEEGRTTLRNKKHALQESAIIQCMRRVLFHKNITADEVAASENCEHSQRGKDMVIVELGAGKAKLSQAVRTSLVPAADIIAVDMSSFRCKV